MGVVGMIKREGCDAENSFILFLSNASPLPLPVGEFLFIFTDKHKQHAEQEYWTAAKTVNAQTISNQMRQVFCEPFTVLNMCA